MSLVLLCWLVLAAGRAPYINLWPWSPASIWIANALMAISVLFAVCGIGIANPFSLGGVSSKTFNPNRPGFLALTRHPLLWALALWSLAHMIVNGDLAHVLLFGVMGIFTILGTVIMEQRAQRKLGAAWSAHISRTSFLPFAAIVRGRVSWFEPLSWRLLLGAVVWLVILALHRPILGVSPLPLF